MTFFALSCVLHLTPTYRLKGCCPATTSAAQVHAMAPGATAAVASTLLCCSQTLDIGYRLATCSDSSYAVDSMHGSDVTLKFSQIHANSMPCVPHEQHLFYISATFRMLLSDKKCTPNLTDIHIKLNGAPAL